MSHMNFEESHLYMPHRFRKLLPTKSAASPDWFLVIIDFIDYIFDLDDVIVLTEQSISLTENFPTFLKEVVKYDPELDDTEEHRKYSRKWLNQVEAWATLAKSEIDNDFRMFRAHTIVGLWGALESLIEDLALAWLADHPSIFQSQDFPRLRVSITEYLILTEAARLRFIIYELQRELKTELRSGATKFEPLFKIIGLGGSVDGRISQCIYEFQQLRNLVAHRRGIADQRFIDACPRFGYSLGDSISLKDEDMARILNGVLMYVTVLYNRCCRATNVPGLNGVRYESPGFEGALTLSEKSK